MTAAQLSDARRNPVDIWTGVAVVAVVVILGSILLAKMAGDLLFVRRGRNP